MTRLKQQRIILQLCNHYPCTEVERQALINKAQQATRVCGKPIYIFRELMHYLEEKRVVLPGYSFMQDAVGQAITYEQKRLIAMVQKHLTIDDTEALNQLIENAPGLYAITQLKREPKDFSLGEVKREINRSNQIQLLYRLAQELLPTLSR